MKSICLLTQELVLCNEAIRKLNEKLWGTCSDLDERLEAMKTQWLLDYSIEWYCWMRNSYAPYLRIGIIVLSCYQLGSGIRSLLLRNPYVFPIGIATLLPNYEMEWNYCAFSQIAMQAIPQLAFDSHSGYQSGMLGDAPAYQSRPNNVIVVFPFRTQEHSVRTKYRIFSVSQLKKNASWYEIIH